MIPARLDDSSPSSATAASAPPAAHLLQSPSVLAATSSDIPAYELKFLLSEAQAQEIAERLRGTLVPDAHADPQRGYTYATTSLYFDTADFAVYHRIGTHKRRKHRLRRYGATPSIFLERKSKWGERVQKRRSIIPDAELPLLANPVSVTTWPGHWFHRFVMRRALQPVCRIAYERLALMGQVGDDPLRLTFDRNIHGVCGSEWSLDAPVGGTQIYSAAVVCEFKYRVALPALFKQIIQEMQLVSCPVSKYRTFLGACGRVPERGVADA